MGSPVGRESYGDRVPVVVAGITTCLGGREGRPQGEGAQVIGYYDREACVMQSAETVLGVLRDPGEFQSMLIFVYPASLGSGPGWI